MTLSQIGFASLLALLFVIATESAELLRPLNATRNSESAIATAILFMKASGKPGLPRPVQRQILRLQGPSDLN